jgi:hypothetical protein
MDEIIRENRSIILGLISYITKYFDELSNKTIIVENDNVKHMLRSLFITLKFKKKKKTSNTFEINIKNNSTEGLTINNINNLTKIGHRCRLLPWYDKSNPIIMFHNSNKIHNINKIKKQISTFSKTQRNNWVYNNYMYLHFVKTKSTCVSVNLWDIYKEYDILLKYINKHKKFNNIFEVHDFISHMLHEQICNDVIIITKNIPIPFNNTIIKKDPNINQSFPSDIKDKADNEPSVHGLIKSLNKKLNIVNELLVKN